MAQAGEIIGVAFGSLDAGEAGLMSTFSGVIGALDDLKASVEGNLSAWDGDARATYFMVKARWEADAMALGNTLGRIGGHVGESNSGYRITETKNTAVIA